MRKQRKNRYRSRRLVSGALLLAVVSGLIWGLWQGARLLGRAGENLAVLSAAMLLPDGSAPILEERFRAEIYNPEGEHATGEKEQGVPLEPEEEPEPADPPEPEPSESEPEEETPQKQPPRIPSEYGAPIFEENFSSKEGDGVIRHSRGLIRNETNWEDEEVRAVLADPWPVTLEDREEPQVLLVHTHATEAFETWDAAQYDVRNTWRSTDNRQNMVAVGDAMAQVLEDRGIGVLHDTTQHDYPSYNGSYERSAETIKGYLEQYPTIKVVLDLHRDAMQRGNAIVKPVAMVDGKKAAQIMIISACDEGDQSIPLWRENLRFAAAFQDYMEGVAPGLTRPVFFCYRKYNMDLTTGSLLLEFGSNANTLEEAVYSATLAGEALADLLQDNIRDGAGDEADRESEDLE